VFESLVQFLFKYPGAVYANGELVLGRASDTGWLLLVFAVAIVLLALSAAVGARVRGLSLARRVALGSLQAGVVATVLLLLLQPSLVVERLQPGANSVAVLIDGSESMALPAGAGASRAGQALALARTLTADLGGRVEPVLFEFDTAARRLESLGAESAGGTQTRLVRSLEDVLASFRGAPLAGVVVYTDGADTSAAPTLAGLAAAGVPVHTVGLGNPALAAETVLEDVELPVDVPVRSRVGATVTLRHQGGARALIRVLENGRLVTAKPVDLPPGQEIVRTGVAFESGRAGIRDLSFEVVPEGPDTLEANNRLSRLVTVSERTRAVLYLEGEPRWEYKFLRRALAGDDVVELSTYLKTTDRKSYRQGVASSEQLAQGLPTAPDELFGFDLLILGSLPATDLTEAQRGQLESFVSRRGGSLLVLPGRHSLAAGGWQDGPLERLLPVGMGSADAYGRRAGRAVVTAAGALSPVTTLPAGEGGDPWATLPPLGDFQRAGALKPAASVLLAFAPEDGGPEEPLLVTQPYGLGTVAWLATATTWRWQTRTDATDTRHQRFWRQLTRHLAGQAQQPRQVTVAVQDDALVLRARLHSPAFEPLTLARPSARVTAPDGSVTETSLIPGSLPGEYVSRLGGRAPGVHKVDLVLDDGSVVTRFVRLGQENLEQRVPVQNVALLKRIAEATGGRYWTAETSGGIPDTLTYAGSGVRERQVLPLWNMPAAFLLLLGLKLGEWLLRRRWGCV
jgi:hypothetical protein